MKVKICGVTNPKDADFAASAGADYIGVNFSKKSKRKVTLTQAKEIYSAIQDKSTELVGVFVDETAEEILTICNETNINTIQLHGNRAREQIRYLRDVYTIFYAVPNVEDEFRYDPALRNQIILLFDNQRAGSGEMFNWGKFMPPKRPWILAGGLNKENVGDAIQLLHPYMVDVASGVECRDSIRKDHALIAAFIKAAKQENES